VDVETVDAAANRGVVSPGGTTLASELIARAAAIGAGEARCASSSPLPPDLRSALRACEVRARRLADGWGQPAEWLRQAENYFHSADVPAVASACRAMLRSTGEKVAQHRDGTAEIPQRLRSAGVTVREYEVLRYLVDRPGNREIADRLHLSPRTVERHISSLIAKTGLPNRVALSKLACTITPTRADQLAAARTKATP